MTRQPLVLVAAALALAAGTFALRLALLLRSRISLPPRAQDLLETAAVVVLAALVATTALTTGHHLAGAARPLGVLAGGMAAWRKAPFVVVILIAAGTTALLRLRGAGEQRGRGPTPRRRPAAPGRAAVRGRPGASRAGT